MTLQQLEYILAVNQFRHFAKAAEYCRVTQPTLSAMIQKLEEELDTRIFDRSQQPVCPTPVGILIIEQAQKILVQANRIKNIIEEEKHSLTGTFKLGILPTVAPYLLPRFFPQLMKKYPDLDIRVIEMKTNDIKKALQTGEIDAGIVASLAGMEELQQTPLFYEQFFVYVSRKDILFNSEVIRTSDLNGEQLWLLDEGHCFRDQLVRFCQMESHAPASLPITWAALETFMRMVESGKGVTFIPELAVLQLGDIQKELVRPFAIPCPTRQIVMLTNKNFIRHTLLEALTKEIKSSIPKEMLSLKATQANCIDFIISVHKTFQSDFLFYREKMLYFLQREKQRTKPIKKRKIMEPIINSQLPEFKVQAFQNGNFKTVSHEDVKGKWAIFFFYPADFTFVCPTELVDIAEKYDQFQAMGVEVYSVSTDSHFVHKAWHDASESIRKIKYPMLADPTGVLSRAFGVMIEEEGMAYRGTFLVNPEGKIKIAEIQDNNIGRNADELLRKVEAAQFVATHDGEVCPAKWKKGAATLKPSIDLVGKI